MRAENEFRWHTELRKNASHGMNGRLHRKKFAPFGVSHYRGEKSDKMLAKGNFKREASWIKREFQVEQKLRCRRSSASGRH